MVDPSVHALLTHTCVSFHVNKRVELGHHFFCAVSLTYPHSKRPGYRTTEYVFYYYFTINPPRDTKLSPPPPPFKGVLDSVSAPLMWIAYLHIM